MKPTLAEISIGWKCSAELSPRVGLAKGPVRRSNIIGHHSTAVTGGDLKREGLSAEIVVALPVLAPVP